jgi:predicted permease
VLILDSLAPVFLLIAVGAVLQRTAFVSPNFLREANRITYWLGLPSLLFAQLAQAAHGAGEAGPTLGAMLGATVIVIGLTYALGALLRVPASRMGTLVQGGFRGNLAFIGLPLLYALPDVRLAGGLSSHAAAVVLVAPMMVFYNIAAVIVLLISRHSFGWGTVAPVLGRIATNPILLATVAGVTFAATGLTLPRPLARTFDALGELAMPLGLLSVGGALVSAQLGANWRLPSVSAVVKTLVSPLLGWACSRWLALGARETAMIMVFMATPTAVVSYTMAAELGGDESLASGSIVLSTFAALPILAAILAWFVPGAAP